MLINFSTGTSLAAPLWSSILTLINEERTAVGKGPVGFVNPVLYESESSSFTCLGVLTSILLTIPDPWALNDIVNGSNPGCGSSGFQAVSGWDPITGLGTPNYPRLLELFMRLK
jgi:tripeptidyl-peptidase-1